MSLCVTVQTRNAERKTKGAENQTKRCAKKQASSVLATGTASACCLVRLDSLALEQLWVLSSGKEALGEEEEDEEKEEGSSEDKTSIIFIYPTSSCIPAFSVLKEAGEDMVVASEMGEVPPALPPTTLRAQQKPWDAKNREQKLLQALPRTRKKKRTQKRKETCGEESRSHVEKSRRKTGKGFGDGPMKRCRKTQKAKKPRTPEEVKRT
ncbi:hypothetical protein AV530_018704 [Patagioenas fasciata monilis]|uniref:Uncharacterized protein n=1 Tax=Patagioenas fasciata monilis TaxID=372326 RepID=A0A1V4JJ74_PATFA|nr:hypothetical protein AV530_018704 [Patagioenas fasciata monilis]